MTDDNSLQTLTATTADARSEPRSAAEHYLAAETLFARARAMYLDLGGHGVEMDDYRRCLEWAGIHLRCAEVLIAGGELSATHLRLKGDNFRLNNVHIGSEARQWSDMLAELHDTPKVTS
ncbi:hypothetical protein ACIA5G_52195 [Amycolatopsis sp. NPDC051758]|uniref:hypothetical protein n=1 Tax=Amycolatopsis sp. NPDC051758 TaxID=3363935 RepID=UPI00378E93CD